MQVVLDGWKEPTMYIVDIRDIQMPRGLDSEDGYIPLKHQPQLHQQTGGNFNRSNWGCGGKLGLVTLSFRGLPDTPVG